MRQTRRRRSKSKYWMLFSLLILFMGYNAKVCGIDVQGGQIATNTVWTLDQSPYIIEGDVIVKAGSTLTIEPGVEIRFVEINLEEGETNRGELIIQGKLLARGSVDHPILFTSDLAMPDMGSWGGIYLQGDNSSLEYVQIEYAINGVTISGSSGVHYSEINNNLEAGIEVQKLARPTLIGNELTYNRVGLLLSGGGLVQENRFHSNSYGLLADGVTDLKFSGNSFESNNYGIYLENLGAGNQLAANLISGNDYGIYLLSGIPPKVNYNDLYNNSLFDFYNLSGSDVDARYNWWGYTDPAIIEAYIYDQNDNPTLPIGYVDYSGYLGVSALAPTVLNLVTEPKALRSGLLEVTVTFSKEMNTLIKPLISYGAVNPFTQYQVSSGAGKWLSYTQYEFTVNIPESFAEGQYRFRITDGESLDGQQLKTNINYAFVVDRTAPEVFFTGDSVAFSPNGDEKKDEMQVQIYLNELAKVNYSITDNGVVVYGPIDGGNYLADVNLTWDGKDNNGSLLKEGEYRLEILVSDQAGNQSTEPVAIPVLIDLTPPTINLDPILGIQADSLSITGEITDSSSPMTYLEYRYLAAPVWESLGQVPGNVYGEIINWDLVGLTDGRYQIKIYTDDQAGNETQKILEVNVDGNRPQIDLTVPVDGLHVTREVVFQGIIKDYYLQDWRVELETQEGWKVLVTGVETIIGDIYTLNLENYADGPYRYRVVARDQVGHVEEVSGTFNVDNATPPEIRLFNLLPEEFSPNGDGIKDELSLQVSCSEVVDWTFEIYNNLGELVQYFDGQGQLVRSSWNGEDDQGHQVADGRYTYQFSYVDLVGHSGIMRSGEMTIDTLAPDLTIEPLLSLTSKSSMILKGQVQDYYQVLINGQKIVVEQGNFLVELQLSEGLNQIEVVAEDLAGNRQVKSFEIISDITSPIIQLNPLKEQTNQKSVQVSGYITDANLTTASVLLTNQQGIQERELELDEENYFAFELTLTPGSNQLLFTATDGAGNQSELFVEVKYLATIPELYLLQPLSPYVAESDPMVIIQVVEGTIPLAKFSVQVELDGQVISHEWDEVADEVKVRLVDLSEGRHSLRVNATNQLGEAAGELVVEMVVDLTDPELRIDQPQTESSVDGWDGELQIFGAVSDENLQQLLVTLCPEWGHETVILDSEIKRVKLLEGELATVEIGDFANGQYVMKLIAIDKAGRRSELPINLTINNTGLIQGQVLGDLDKIPEPHLLLVNACEVKELIPFDQLSGEFSGRVAVGEYDLVLAPWGYALESLAGLNIRVGQTYSGLFLNFDDKLNLVLNPDKQLIAVPFKTAVQPPEVVGLSLKIHGWDGGDYYTFQDWTFTQPGRGYWLTGEEELKMTFSGEAVAKAKYQLFLKAGWNLISTPYNYSYPVREVEFVFAGQSYSFEDALLSGKVDGGVWRYLNWYQKSDTLEPWWGYWLYVTEGGEICFDPEKALVPYRSSNNTHLELNRIQDREWQVQMRASLGKLLDIHNYFGTSKFSTLGIDTGLDLREPPGYAPYISLSFVEGGAERLTTSLQPPVQGSSGSRIWEMIVESPVTGWVRLGWDLDPEAILALELEDQVSGERINMFSQASYEYYHQGGVIDHFTITAKKGDFQLKSAYNYPNPFTPVGGSSDVKRQGTNIRYLLTHDAQIDLAVFDVMGRPVKGFEPISAGSEGGLEGWNQFYWDGRNGRGESVANGTYILKITASYGKIKQVKTLRMAVINRR